MPGSVLWGWAGPLLVTFFGAFLRFNRLGLPHAVLFDETYYVPDAYGILKHGVEIDHVSDVNALLARGSTHILEGTKGEYVVHPPLGKMLIAVGEWLFGLTPFGWRFAVALVGSLAILMTADYDDALLAQENPHASLARTVPALAAALTCAAYEPPNKHACTSSGCSWCSGTRARHPSASGAVPV